MLAGGLWIKLPEVLHSESTERAGGALSPGAGRGTTCSTENESAFVGGYQDLLLCVFGG